MTRSFFRKESVKAKQVLSISGVNGQIHSSDDNVVTGL